MGRHTTYNPNRRPWQRPFDPRSADGLADDLLRSMEAVHRFGFQAPPLALEAMAKHFGLPADALLRPLNALPAAHTTTEQDTTDMTFRTIRQRTAATGAGTSTGGFPTTNPLVTDAATAAAQLPGAGRAAVLAKLAAGQEPAAAAAPVIPEPKPGTMEALYAAIAAVSAEKETPAAGVDEAAVRAIVQQELAGQPSTVITLKAPDQEPRDIKGAHHEKFPLLLKLIASNSGHILISGPAGSGKTTAAEKACEALERPIFVQPPVADKYEVLGFRDATGQYQSTTVYRWATAPAGAVLLLDEVDAGAASAMITLNAMLANGIGCFPHEQVSIPREHLVIANGNTWGGGADFDYCGRNRLDEAFLNRFPTKLGWDYDLKFERLLSGHNERALFIQQVRTNAREAGVKIVISPRDTMSYCTKRSAGFSHQDALDTGFLAKCKEDVRAKLLKGTRDPG